MFVYRDFVSDLREERQRIHLEDPACDVRYEVEVVDGHAAIRPIVTRPER